MPLIELETQIDAPIERVFDLARSIEAHIASAASGGGTLMKDEFNFAAPCGFVGRIAEGRFPTGYMRRFLTKRAAELKGMAESKEWRRYLTDKGEQGGVGDAEGDF